jgi:hypothetical protein
MLVCVICYITVDCEVSLFKLIVVYNEASFHGVPDAAVVLPCQVTTRPGVPLPIAFVFI